MPGTQKISSRHSVSRKRSSPPAALERIARLRPLPTVRERGSEGPVLISGLRRPAVPDSELRTQTFASV